MIDHPEARAIEGQRMTKAKTGDDKAIMFAEMISRRRGMLILDNGQPWFALQTIPGAQLPKREYKTELTKSRKGYRLDVATNHDLSAIERALEAKGFEYYMPTEKRLIRDRRHTDLWKIRRFALMVGYVFIRRPVSWDQVLGTQTTPGVPGVQGVVRSAEGQPMPIEITDILMMRAMEAEYDARFDLQSKNARAKLRRQAKNDPRLKKLIGVLDTAGKFTVPVNSELFAGVAREPEMV